MIRPITVSLLALSLNGRILAPFARSAADIVASPSHREAMLHSTLGEFHRDLSWGDLPGALSHATDSGQAELAKELTSTISSGRKIVDVKVLTVIFEKEHSEAVVGSVIRYFRLPNNLVQAEQKKEHWVFGRLSGWELDRVEAVESEGAEASSYGELVP